MARGCPTALADGPAGTRLAVFAANDDVRGRRLPALEVVLAMPFPAPPRTDGAAVAAEKLLALL